MESSVIECEELVKIYATDEQKVMALQGLDLSIGQGELMAIIGKSGSGKSTLIQMMGGLEVPTAGRMLVEGRDLSEYGEKELLSYRRNRVGFVWQNSAHNLFPFLTAVENVESRMLFTGSGSFFTGLRTTKRERRKRAYELLCEVGVEGCADRYPAQMSGGECQRVAIAVALAGEPSILLADEPTGAVDVETADQIFSLFLRLNRERGLTILIVTHDMSLSAKVDRTVQISDGKISREREEEEYVVMDRAHRLQLGEELLREAGITSNRVRVEVVDGAIRIQE